VLGLCRWFRHRQQRRPRNAQPPVDADRGLMKRRSATVPESCLRQMRNDRRRRAAELERTPAAGEPDRRAVALNGPRLGNPRALC
jgi:hypothetical protein